MLMARFWAFVSAFVALIWGGPRWSEAICGSTSHTLPTASLKSAVAQTRGPVPLASNHVFLCGPALRSSPAAAGIRQGPATGSPCLKHVVPSALFVPPDALAAAESVPSIPREPHVRRRRRRNVVPRPVLIPVPQSPMSRQGVMLTLRVWRFLHTAHLYQHTVPSPASGLQYDPEHL